MARVRGTHHELDRSKLDPRHGGPHRNRCADVVGFGVDGVWATRASVAPFSRPRTSRSTLATTSGGHVDQHPRFVFEVNGDGKGDTLGYRDAGAWMALGHGNVTFCSAGFILAIPGVKSRFRAGAPAQFRQ